MEPIPTRSQLDLLQALASDPDIPLPELATTLGVTRQALYQRLLHLKAAGWVALDNAITTEGKKWVRRLAT